MPRYIEVDRVRHLIDKALALGATRVSMFRVIWNISGNCSDPYTTEVYGRTVVGGEKHPDRTILVKPGSNTPALLEIHTRCRRCEPCLKTRQRRWAGAAIAETRMSTRTWFGTLTLAPEWQFRTKIEAINYNRNRGVDFDSLSADEQFVAHHRAIGVELTRYLKRVRKNADASFRYLLVAEKHQSGDPHYHMLLHENATGGKVLHRHLSEAWRYGFESWRLSDPLKPHKTAYLCKYLSKTLAARVRASQRYGVASSDYHARILQALMGLVEENGREAAGFLPSSSYEDPHFRF